MGSNAYRLDSQAYVTSSDDAAGFRFLTAFFMTDCLLGKYMAEGVRVTKRLTLVYGTNSRAIQYQLYADEGVDPWIEVIPVYGFHSKNDRPLTYETISCQKRRSPFYVNERGKFVS